MNINWSNVGSWAKAAFIAAASGGGAVVSAKALPPDLATSAAGTLISVGLAALAHELSQPDSWPQAPFTAQVGLNMAKGIGQAEMTQAAPQVAQVASSVAAIAQAHGVTVQALQNLASQVQTDK